jgi:hypothetical protein
MEAKDFPFSEATHRLGNVIVLSIFEIMTSETTPQSGASGATKNVLLMFLIGLAAGSAGTYLLAGPKISSKENEKQADSLKQHANGNNPGKPAEAPVPISEASIQSMAKPKGMAPLPGGIDVNGFAELAANEAIAVSYQDYLGFTNAWAQSHPNNQPSCTWGGRIHKEALSRVINSLPEDNPWVRFKFGNSNTESRTFIMFTGNLNAQGGSVIYRNGGEPTTFCPIQCD